MSTNLSDSNSNSNSDYDIDIHLSPSRPPDPTTVSDYLVVVLLAVILFGYAFFARGIRLLTIQWPILKWINVPMLIAMSAFSVVHLGAVFLTESYFPSLTDRVDELSCTLVPYWMEYAIGLGGFSAVLVLRLVSMCMVLFPLCFAESMVKRMIIQGAVVLSTHGPLIVICIVVTAAGAAEHVEEPHPHCATPLGYKIAIVAWLLYIITVLVGMTVAVRNAVVAKMEVEVMVDVVKMFVAMLLVGCVLHFLYLLSYWWGRLLFMLMVCTMHTYAYYRYVLPVWTEYMVHGTDEARKASAARMAQMCGPVEFVLQSSLKVTPRSLLSIQELRKSFFDYIGSRDNIHANLCTMTVVSTETLQTLDINAPEEVRDRLGFMEDYHAITRVLHYYDLLRQLAEFDGGDAGGPGADLVRARHATICRLHTKLVQNHLTPGGIEYLHMDNGTRSELIHALADPDEDNWNFGVFSKTAKRVATMLCDALSAQYTHAEYGTILRIQEERSRQLRALHQLGLYDRPDPTGASAAVAMTEEYAGVVSSLVQIIKGPTRSPEEIEMDSLLSGADSDIPPAGSSSNGDDCATLQFSDGGHFEDSLFEQVELGDS